MFSRVVWFLCGFYQLVGGVVGCFSLDLAECDCTSRGFRSVG